MGEILGLDVSHYQGNIDWKLVSESGRKFAILKCMYEAQSHRIDEQFENNYRGCGIYGLLRGVYIFIGRASINNPEADAKALLSHLSDRALEYGIWLDYESEHLRKIGKEKLLKLTYVYSNAFRSSGYHVGIYCNKDWYDNVIPKELKEDFDFWIARYPKNDIGAYNGKSSLKPSIKTAVAWQYSSKGRIPGIKNHRLLRMPLFSKASQMKLTSYMTDCQVVLCQQLRFMAAHRFLTATITAADVAAA